MNDPNPVPTETDQSADDHLDAILLRIGRLNYAWSNTESLLVHLMAGLGGMRKEAATIVFLSIGTTRGRIELVERMAKAFLPKNQQQRLLDLMAQFSRLSAIRNRYNHSLWSFEEDGSVSTIMMRIADRRDKIHMGQRQSVGPREIERLDQDLAKLAEVNAQIWNFLSSNKYPIR